MNNLASPSLYYVARKCPLSVALSRAVDSPALPNAFALSSKALLGAGYFPFASFSAAMDITSARYRIDGGTWTDIDAEPFGDIVVAIRSLLLRRNVLKTQTIDLELNTSIGTFSLSVDVTNGIRLGTEMKHGDGVKPFSDSVIAFDDDYIQKIEYRKDGGSWTTLTQSQIVSGSHSGSHNSQTLTDSTKDFTTYDIRIGTDVVRNITDGSQGVISDVGTTTISTTLAGGTDNDFDTNDQYVVYRYMPLHLLVRQIIVNFGSSGIHSANLKITDTSNNEHIMTCFVTV